MQCPLWVVSGHSIKEKIESEATSMLQLIFAHPVLTHWVVSNQIEKLI